MTELSTRQISEAGRLLVQYQLAKHGIAAQPSDSDAAFHLRVERSHAAETIRTYTNRSPKPAGGKGRPALDWYLDGKRTSDWIADRKSTRLNSSHGYISYAVFCL